MRVKYTRDHGEYLKGAVVDLDEGVAASLIDLGVVKEHPRSTAELAEAAAKYYPGDEHRTAKQKAERAAQVVPLTGDTRSDVEALTGDDDPHAVRASLAEKAERRLATEQRAAEKQEAEAETARAKAEKETKAKADAAEQAARGAPRG